MANPEMDVHEAVRLNGALGNALLYLEVADGISGDYSLCIEDKVKQAIKLVEEARAGLKQQFTNFLLYAVTC